VDDDGAGEEPLTGGTMGGAVRVGETVRRRAGPWTPTVQRLLAHLRRRGVLSHLPDVVPQHPAHLAYRLVPLTDPGNPDVPASTTAERARRLRVLCEAYGPLARVEDVAATAVHRLEDLAEFTAARHAQGQDELAGHAELYRRDARWIAEHLDELTSAVTLVRSPGLFAGAEYAYVPSTLLGVTVLGYEDQLVELEATAAVLR